MLEYKVTLLRKDSEWYQRQIENVLKICDELLGEGLYSRKRMDDICQKEHHYFYTISKEEVVVGIFYCYAEQFGSISFFQNMGLSMIAPDMRIGVAKSIALAPDMRNKGFSEKLLKECSEFLFEKEKVEAILIPAWMKNGKIPAENHLVKCSYEFLKDVEHPWAIYQDLKCPVCKKKPCMCDGAIYIRWREAHGE